MKTERNFTRVHRRANLIHLSKILHTVFPAT